MPPDPLDAALEGGNRAGADRCPREKPAEVLEQGLGARIAPLRNFVEAFQADGFQVPGDVRDQAPGRDGLLGAKLLQSLQHPHRLERTPARQQLVEDRAQSVDVGSRTYRSRISPSLFRGHVPRRSQQDTAGRLR
jgi:hypothetical protein